MVRCKTAPPLPRTRAPPRQLSVKSGSGAGQRRAPTPGTSGTSIPSTTLRTQAMANDAQPHTVDDLNRLFGPLLPGLLGMRITTAAPERVTAEIVVRPDLCTAGGIMHGGTFMAFADTLGAVATVMNLPPQTRTTTIESKTNFIGGAPAGSKVTGECTPFHRGRTTMVWQTVIRNEAGKTLAVVSQTQLVIPV
jgi:1,4-dihydroxy-2-naphthoyl-CoA hydrolase